MSSDELEPCQALTRREKAHLADQPVAEERAEPAAVSGFGESAIRALSSVDERPVTDRIFALVHALDLELHALRPVVVGPELAVGRIGVRAGRWPHRGG